MMRRKPGELMTKRSTRSPHLLGILDDNVIVSWFFFDGESYILCMWLLSVQQHIQMSSNNLNPMKRATRVVVLLLLLWLRPGSPYMQMYNENRLAARTKVRCAAAPVQATGRCWGCYPQRPGAGIRDGRCRTPPPILVPFRRRHSDWRASSSCGWSPESDAPDTPGSSGRDPAGAAGSSPWKGVNTGETWPYNFSVSH